MVNNGGGSSSNGGGRVQFSQNLWIRRFRRAGVGLFAAAMGLLLAVTLPASAVLRATAGPADNQPVNTWPKMAYDVANSGVSPDPDISTANAPDLGVRWMVPTGTTEYSSPVVAWNAQLQETLVYQGNENGYLTAFNEANGQTVWSDFLGSAIRDTPLVEGNYVWVSDTFSPVLVKLDAATGAQECSVPMESTNNGTATIGAGPNGQMTVYIAENDLGTANGPMYAINEANCAVDWTYTSFNGNDAAGSWDPMAYATSANGTPLVVFGTADPDSSVYAVNAATGATVWSYVTLSNPTFADDDVGAGVSITAPGVNGFADGVAYVPGKDGYMYALDLTTGALIWDFNFGQAFNVGPEYSRATPAVMGDDVIFGGTMGVAELNATTGAVVWRSTAAGGGEVLSAIAVVGPSGQQVVAVTSLSGELSVFNAATGALLYSYQMGYFSVASVSDVDGNLLVNSSDGFLYDFAVGGANSGAPTTAVTSPADAASVTNPDGSLTISGTASGGPIAGVNVAVQEGGSTGMWWDAAAGAFTPGYSNNLATLVTPGADSTGWSLAVPIPPSGGTYTVQASAFGTNGLADTTADSAEPSPSQDAFTVGFLRGAPHMAPTDGMYVAPGASIGVSGTGFGDSEKVAISLAGTTLTTVTTGSTGGFPAVQVPIPATAAFGETSLVATGQTSGDTSNATVYISNEWASSGYNSLNTASEPNDLILRYHVAPVSSEYLTQAWSYPSGAAIDTTPAIYRGVLYFGNEAGTVTALSIHQSVPLWTYQAGSAVDSSPLVVNGQVIFGTSAGSVVSLSAATGAVKWTTPTSSAVDSSPTVSGNLVAVGSANGTVYGLSVANGKILWQDTLSGAVSGAPAIDPAIGDVVVGAGDTVTALSKTNGSVLWTTTTGGAVTADPSIMGGKVYIGSGDSNVYQLSESTGTIGWTFHANGPITAGGSIMTFKGTDYVVGTKSGEVYFLGINNGKSSKEFDTPGGAVVGVTSSPGFALVTTAAGDALGYKYTGGASFQYSTPSGFNSSGAIVNGIVYLTSLDQTVRAFSIPGRPIP
jgi:outer membrane protein assembly factor BamB